MRISFCLLLVAGLWAARGAAGATCACSELSGSGCEAIIQTSPGQCQRQSKTCSGCICDVSGTRTCDVGTAEVYEFDSGAETSCSPVNVTRVTCIEETPSPTPTPEVFLQEVSASCGVSGLLPNFFECEFDCFPDSYGSLVNVTVDYTASMTGSYALWNNGSTTSNLDFVAQTALALAYTYDENSQAGNATIPSDADHIITAYSMTFLVSPTLSDIDLAPGDVVTVDPTSGSTTGSDLAPTNSQGGNYFLCSEASNGGSATTGIATVYGQTGISASGSFNFTSEGTFTFNMTLKYLFQSSTISGTVIP